SLPMPGYPGFRIATAGPSLRAALAGHGTELVHLASPFMLGGAGAAAGGRLRLPTVAVSQPDVPPYARAYRFGPAGQAAAWGRLRRIHNAADRTLAPSSAAAASLHEHGIERVWLWGGAPCRGRCSWASATAGTWPASTPPSTCSSTAGRTRRSGRRFRRPRRAGSPWSRPRR